VCVSSSMLEPNPHIHVGLAITVYIYSIYAVIW